MINERMRIAAALALGTALTAAPIELIGTGSVSGGALDKSGLTGQMTWPHSAPTSSAPAALLGGWGSGLTYSGYGNLFLATPDRGPGDGLVDSYLDRYHVFAIDLDTSTNTVTANLVSTKFLVNESGANFVGQSRDFGMRFDPEGVRVGKDGTFFVSDEYGPYIYEFDASGKRIRTIAVPSKFGISNLDENATPELSDNIMGRQTNRGMEGLAISPDGRYLFGIMQNSLLQDGGLDAGLTRRGLYNRILRIDLEAGNTAEFVYPLVRRQNGVNEMVAINNHEFLVLERDGNAGANAEYKQIFKIDITGATDVSNVTLPQSGPLGAIVPVSKQTTPFIDMLDAQFGLAGASFPEKIEALSWGPKLPDGRLTLYVASDNDFLANTPSRLYAFAIDPTALNFEAQQIDTFLATPEPGTIALLLPAIAIGALWRRRRGHSSL